MIEKKTSKFLKKSPLPEKKQLKSFMYSTRMSAFFCLFFQLLSTAAMIKVGVFTCSIFCHVNLLARTGFENICFCLFSAKINFYL